MNNLQVDSLSGWPEFAKIVDKNFEVHFISYRVGPRNLFLCQDCIHSYEIELMRPRIGLLNKVHE